MPRELFVRAGKSSWLFPVMEEDGDVRFIREDVHNAHVEAAVFSALQPKVKTMTETPGVVEVNRLFEIIINRYDLRPSEARALIAEMDDRFLLKDIHS